MKITRPSDALNAGSIASSCVPYQLVQCAKIRMIYQRDGAEEVHVEAFFPIIHFAVCNPGNWIQNSMIDDESIYLAECSGSTSHKALTDVWSSNVGTDHYKLVRVLIK